MTDSTTQDQDQGVDGLASGSDQPPKQARGPFSRLRSRFGKYEEMLGDVLWSGLADLFLILGNLASFSLLAIKLAPAGYGSYIGFFAITGPLGSLCWAGLTLVVLQRIIREKENHNEVGQMALTLLLGQGSLGVVVAMIGAHLFIDDIPFLALLLIAIVELILAPIVMLTAALRQAIISFPAAARVKMTLISARTLVLIALWAAGRLTLLNLGLGWALVVGALGLFCLRSLLPAMGIHPGFRMPTRQQASNVSALSIPMASGNLQNDGDKLVLNAYGLQEQAGWYGAAFRIVLLAQLPIQTMNTALFHRFLSHDEGARGQHLRRAKNFTIISTGLSVMIGAVLFFAAPVLPIFFSEFDESVQMIRALVVFLPLVAVSHAPLNGLLGLGADRLRAVILFSTAVLSLILYVSLIPQWGWKGALTGTVISELVLLAAGWASLITLQRRFDASLNSPPSPISEVQT